MPNLRTKFLIVLDCLQELRWLYDRRDLTEAPHGSSPWAEGPRDLAAWLAK
jgi:hypothetical protein